MSERKDGKPKKKTKVGEISASTGRPRPSPSGKRNPKVDMTNWRVKLRARQVKFDDDQKNVYLGELERTGLKEHSARVAGTTRPTVIKHLKNDPDFKDMYEAAVQFYNDSVAAEVLRRGRDGYLKPVWKQGERAMEPLLDEDGIPKKDRNGNLIMIPATIREYSDRLLELEAKRGNPEFRDKPTVGIDATGGVIVLSGDLTVEEAEVRDAKLNAEAIKKRESEGK